MKKLALVGALLPLFLHAQTITTRVGGILANGVTGGTQGLVLKQVGAGILAQQQLTYAFDPGGASAVIPLLWVTSNVQNGILTLDMAISHYTNPPAGCPNPALPNGTEPTGTALREMMWHADNARAFEIQATYGLQTFNGFSRALGLRIAIPQIPGCNIPGVATLNDLGILYEGVVSGAYLSSARPTFLGLLAGKAQASAETSDYAHIWDTDLPAMIRQEAPSGMTQAQMTLYRNSMDLGYKTGAAVACQNSGCTQVLEDLSIAGWARVPFCSGSQTATRDFVFGVFISGAPDLSWSPGKSTAAQKAFAAGRAETLREQIHDGLASCYGGDAVLVNPAPGATLAGRTVPFSWSAAPSAAGYRLDIGRTLGGFEYGSAFTANTSALFTNLPCDGSTVYARLWSRVDQYGNPRDYQYRACSNAGPVITNPSPGSALASSSTTFTWTAVTSADSYRLSLGTILGGNDLGLVTTTTTSATINNIPRDQIVYARIEAHTSSFSTPNDFAYNNTAGQGPIVSSVVNAVTLRSGLSPASLAVLTGSNFGTDAVVKVDGARAQVIGTPTGTQITFLIPPTLTPHTASLVLSSGGASGAAFPITLATASPGLYAPLLDDSGAPLAVTRTLKPGDVAIARVTGIGALNASGQPSLAIRVLVNGLPAAIVSTQPSASSPGVTQIAFSLPPGLPSGPVPVTVEAASIASNPVNVIIAGPAVASVLNGASFATGAKVAPGSLISIFGTDLATSDQLGVFPSTQLPGGGAITIDGVSAPLFDVVASAGQINLLVPFEARTDGAAPVVVANGKGTGAPFQLAMAPAAPGIFRIGDPSNSKRLNAAALIANTAWRVIPVSMAGALGMVTDCKANRVDAASLCGEPAAIGDAIQIYVTGLGRATPNGNPVGNTLKTGDVAPAGGNPLYRTVETPRVTIGGVDAAVAFSGVAPGFAGLYQVNVTVPAGAATGDDVPLTITIGGASDTATIAIRP
jgi:uncharacterized protein (TIGR03437 family)